jgi:hypothetical protein
VLTLYSDYSFGPEVTFNQTYYFHQLSEPLDDSVSYFSYNTVNYHPDAIGSIEFTVSKSADTVMIIKMNHEYGQKFFNDLLNPSIIDQKNGQT